MGKEREDISIDVAKETRARLEKLIREQVSQEKRETISNEQTQHALDRSKEHYKMVRMEEEQQHSAQKELARGSYRIQKLDKQDGQIILPESLVKEFSDCMKELLKTFDLDDIPLQLAYHFDHRAELEGAPEFEERDIDSHVLLDGENDRAYIGTPSQHQPKPEPKPELIHSKPERREVGSPVSRNESQLLDQLMGVLMQIYRLNVSSGRLPRRTRDGKHCPDTKDIINMIFATPCLQDLKNDLSFSEQQYSSVAQYSSKNS